MSRSTAPTLQSERVLLNGLTRPDQAEWLALCRSNAAWLARFSVADPSGPGPVQAWGSTLRTQRRESAAGRQVPWVLRVPDAGRPALAGQVTLSSITWGATRSASLGYWVGEQWAGRGLMREALALVMAHAMASEEGSACAESGHPSRAKATGAGDEGLGLHRLEALVHPDNQRSWELLSGLGFRDEGMRRGALHARGQWQDHRVAALTSEDLRSFRA